MTTFINSEELKEITQQLADVELPPAPDWQPLIIAVTVVVVAILLAVGVVYLRSRRKGSNKVSDAGRDALHQLQLLRQEWQQNEVDDHDAAYRLATLLRLGLGLKQLTDTPPPAIMNEQPQWQQILQQLTLLRYQRRNEPQHSIEPRHSGECRNDEGVCPPEGSGENSLSGETFAQVEQWLKQGGGPC